LSGLRCSVVTFEHGGAPSSGGQRLIADLYDQGPRVAIPVLTRIAASSSVQ